LEATGLANTYKPLSVKHKPIMWRFRKNDKWFYNYINQRFTLAFENYITCEYSLQSLEYLNNMLDLISKFSKCRRFTPPSYDKLLYNAVYFGHTHAVEWLFNNTKKFIEFGLLSKYVNKTDKIHKLFAKAASHNNPGVFRLVYNHFIIEKQLSSNIIGGSLEPFMRRILVYIIDIYNWNTQYHPHLHSKWPTKIINLLVELCPEIQKLLTRNLDDTFCWQRLNPKVAPNPNPKIKVIKLNHLTSNP
jgi:hypothetical protein